MKKKKKTGEGDVSRKKRLMERVKGEELRDKVRGCGRI